MYNELIEYKELIMKKAFTLSEALVTLAIIGVLAAILIPVISTVRPDKDKISYKKALYSMQSAVSNAMDSTVYSIAANSAAYWKDQNIGDEDFCRSVADSLNTAGTINCSNAGYNCDSDLGPKGPGGSCYSSPNFITTDGIRYWGLEGKFTDQPDQDSRTIYVDRALSSGELDKLAKDGSLPDRGLGLKIQVSYDGKIGTPSNSTDFNYEDELIENSLDVTKGK